MARLLHRPLLMHTFSNAFEVVAKTVLHRDESEGLRPGELDAPLGMAPCPRPVLTGVLGSGGMGTVYRTFEPVLGRHVAMKVMHPEIAVQAEGEKWFLREARVQARLEHPGVVPVYSLGRDEYGAPAFTMKEVRGQTLQAVLTGLAEGDAELCKRFPRRRLLTIFVQVCRTLEYAHARGVVHRDVKPGNVMLGDFGEVHVLDWGLATMAEEAAADLNEALVRVARPGSVMGTPGYMPPEQILGMGVDERTDVYALGAMLYELLTLTPMVPLTAEDRLTFALRMGPRSPLAEAPTLHIAPELDEAVLFATHPVPDHRTATVKELADAVERYLDGDRDLELRRSLATGHLERARGHLETGCTPGADALEAAMTELLSGLALDPQNGAVRSTLQRVLALSPASLPRELDAGQQEALAAERRELVRAIGWRSVVWLFFAPVVWAMGPRHPAAAVAIILAIVALCGASFLLARKGAPRPLELVGVLGGVSVAMAAFTAILGPFLIVPALAATALVMAAGHLDLKGRTGFLLATLAGVLGPFGLEVAGLVPAAHAFAGTSVTLLPRLVEFPPGPTAVVLVAVTAMSLTIPTLLAGRLRDRLALAEGRLRLASWYLERLARAR